jgi:hypothetical protein
VVVEEAEAGVIGHAAIRLVAVRHRADAEARATTAGVPAGARHQGGGNVIVLLDEAAEVEEDGVPAIRMPATGVTAETAAAVGIAAGAGGENTP